MKITNDIYEVYESGTVISFGEIPTKFHVAEDFIINFVFKKDLENPTPKVSFTSINNIEGNLILLNFTNNLGEGTGAPIKMGSLNNRSVYLNFRVYTLGEDVGNKTIHYTFYLGEEVING
jgi:hypothetical protein